MSRMGRDPSSQGPADRFLEHEAAGVPDAASSELLEEVLQRTMLSLDGQQALTPSEWQALCAVRQRHGDQPLSLDPITIELVQAVLGGTDGVSPEEAAYGWERSPLLAASRHVAEFIYDDPTARQRLERLWTGLAGGCP